MNTREKERPSLRLFLTALAVYVTVYGTICLRLGRHWDEVLDFDGSAFDTYMAGGRWFLGAWRYLTGSWEPLAVSAFVAGLVISCLLVLQGKCMGLRHSWQKTAYIVLYMGCIQWGAMLHFSMMVEAISIGMCCASAAAWLCHCKEGWKSGLGAALLLALAIGAYQTLAMYFGVAWLLLRLLELRRHPEAYSLRPWVRLACVSIAGVAVWLSVHKVVLCFLSQETLDYVQGYQNAISQWPVFLSDMGMHDRMLCLAHYFKLSLAGVLGMGEESCWLLATALLPLAGIVWHALRNHKGWQRLEGCSVAMLIWWLPFCMSLFMLTQQGFHTCLAAPLSFAGLWMVWLAGARIQDRHRPLLWVVGCVIVAAASVSVYRDAKEEAALHRNSISLIAAMQEAGQSCAQAANLPQAPVIVLAHLENQEEPFCGAYPMVAGTGFMNWYCKAYGMNGIRMGDAQDMQRHRACWEGMPSWPEGGSVKADGGEIIVKIGRGKE